MSFHGKQRMVKLQLYARNLADLDFFTKSDPYLIISKRNRNTGKMCKVKKTETKNNNLNPDWGMLYLSLQELCDSDFDMKLQIEVYDEDKGKDDLIGSVQLSLNDFQAMARSSQSVQLTLNNKKRGDLYVKLCHVDDPGSEMPSTNQHQGAVGLYNQLNNNSNSPGAQTGGWQTGPNTASPLYPSLSQGDAPPYMAQTSSASSAGYPPSSSAPFPPSNSVPYPPAGGSPYPPSDSGAYPPAGGWNSQSAPYPPGNNSPYPPGNGANGSTRSLGSPWVLPPH